ncbi:hypothetical protein BI001_gp014 [Bacillus phage Zuko]|uniref:hypothetical protein n=1 Tax=Bacillus phage Zuko TaxID=1805956 RepID=UPI0007A76FE3|nr:hypothetical protein BI001_gp014 [Bacillus phage Zuko]AMW62617.1 hypothetical protein ZUKO_14 [Bacillus phage Zuko]
MKVDELVIACSDYPEESQLTAGIHGDYLYVLLEDDKSMPREKNENNFEFFINEDTAKEMYETLSGDNLTSIDYHGSTHPDKNGNKFYISILSTMCQVLLVDYVTYVGITASREDAIKFREYLWIFINREEIGVEV